MTRILVVGEHDGKQLNPSVAKVLNCVSGFQAEQTDVLLMFAEPVQQIIQAAADIEGVSRVLTVKAPEFENPLGASVVALLSAMVDEYSHVLVANTTYGKDFMPRLAALKGVTQISDLMRVESPYIFDRPTYAGNAIVTIEAPSDQLLCATVRCASYSAVGKSAQPAPVEPLEVSVEFPTHTRFIERQAGSSDRPDLSSSKTVVSGGRGVGSSENFKVIYNFADIIGAAVGASRAAVDAGYVPNEMQVGQTGKIIAPDLYFAVGISGAIQHLAGIKDAGTIVAINKDEEAPIFDIADLGLVGDLFTVLPLLEEEIKK